MPSVPVTPNPHVAAPTGLPERLTDPQRQVASYPRDGGQSLFLRGLPGTGKTTALLARLAALLREGRRPSEILVLVPQRAQALPFEQLLAQLDAPVRGEVDVLTFYGLSRRAVSLFWPVLGASAGFAHPEREPTFLTIETTQYFVWRLVEPLIEREGYFSQLTMRRARLLSQLIDNLNKSALMGYSHTDIYQRLRSAWTGTQDHLNVYWQAQDCAIRFREYCLEHSLLDFSLATEVFARHLLTHPVYQRYFAARYRHLLVDNVEENVPVMHDFVAWARPRCQSTVLAHDEGGGHRIFLGADAQGSLELGAGCTETRLCEELLQPTANCLAFVDEVRRALRVEGPPCAPQGVARLAVVAQGGGRYWISMVRWLAQTIVELVEQGTRAEEIAIVAPYVTEVMRFAIEDELAQRGIPVSMLRPATLLRDDPAIMALLTLVLLSHPQWRLTVQSDAYRLTLEDVAHMLRTVLPDLDPIRARHLAKSALAREGDRMLDLSGAEPGACDPQALGRLWETVGYQLRQPYEALRVWLETYQRGDPEALDIMLSRLFGDLLSRPGFSFRDDPALTRACARLVESAAKFRLAVGMDAGIDERDVSRQYVELILGGIASAAYLVDWPEESTEGVILAPAYAYLTRDVRSRFQFWIDLGAQGWWNRPNQPLTHPYVLSRRWSVGRPWRDIEEEQTRREVLVRVLQGLAARCTQGIYLAHSELGMDGDQQNDRLLRALAQAQGKLVLHV
jgi:hypothetical protein